MGEQGGPAPREAPVAGNTANRPVRLGRGRPRLWRVHARHRRGRDRPRQRRSPAAGPSGHDPQKTRGDNRCLACPGADRLPGRDSGSGPGVGSALHRPRWSARSDAPLDGAGEGRRCRPARGAGAGTPERHRDNDPGASPRVDHSRGCAPPSVPRIRLGDRPPFRAAIPVLLSR